MLCAKLLDCEPRVARAHGAVVVTHLLLSPNEFKLIESWS